MKKPVKGSETPKQLKKVAPVDPSHLILPEASQLLFRAHANVLSHAASGGLINPLHFRIKKSGMVGLTQAGFDRAALFRRRPSRTALVEEYIERIRGEMCDKVRNHMEAADFFTKGHGSLLPLRDGLADGKLMDVGNLVECLRDVMMHTGSLCDALDAFSAILRDKTKRWAHDNSPRVHAILEMLYSAYETGQISTGLRMSLVIAGYPWGRRTLATRLEWIVQQYRGIEDLEMEVTEKAKLPAYLTVPRAEAQL